MAKSDPAAQKRERKNALRWVVTVFVVTMIVSGTISLVSDVVMERSSMAVAFLILLMIILVGIVFDIVGMAVASADEKPFHSMAAKKVPGAAEALKLLRNSEKVSNFCNDVVGDICGVVSGSASAVIAVKTLTQINSVTVSQLIMSAVVAGVTIAGKACGKNIAMNSSTGIVHFVSKIIYYIKSPFCRKKRKKK